MPNENKNGFNFSEFNAKFKMSTSFTTYCGLIDAIPPLWKKSLRNQNSFTLVDAPHVTLSTRAIYDTILKKANEPPTAENKIWDMAFLKVLFSKSTVYRLKSPKK